MPRAPKQCGRHGCTEPVIGATYCDEHLAERRRTQALSPTAQHRNSNTERRRRKAVVDAWVRVNGWVCPGYERPAHDATDLTAAHVTAVTHGGGDGPLTVLCRSCNSRQGANG